MFNPNLRTQLKTIRSYQAFETRTFIKNLKQIYYEGEFIFFQYPKIYERKIAVSPTPFFLVTEKRGNRGNSKNFTFSRFHGHREIVKILLV